MRFATVTISLFLVTAPASAQEERPAVQESVYFELFGPVGSHSFNFDARFASGVTFRVGGALAQTTEPYCRRCTVQPPPRQGLIFLTSLNYVAGAGLHHAEFGLGARVEAADPGMERLAFDERIGLLGTIGYRLQTPGRGPILRATVSPMWFGERVRLVAGISAGYSLR
jgi:hypothetical protein